MSWGGLKSAPTSSLFLVITFVAHNSVSALWLVFFQPIQATPADDQERDCQEERQRAGGREPLTRAFVGYEPTGCHEHRPEPARRDAAEQPGRCAPDLRLLERAPPCHARFRFRLRFPMCKC